MNLRSTAWLFAVMFSMLWLFGLMLAFRKNPLDKAYVVPTLQAARDVDIVAVTVQRRAVAGKDAKDNKEAQEFQFAQENDVWRLKDASGAAIKVEGFKINDIVNQIKGARKDDEADVPSFAAAGLDNPRATVTIKGRGRGKPLAKDDDKDKDKKDEGGESKGKEREWKFFLGGESADKKYVYANSSDEPQRVYAVTKSSLDSLFFTDANHLRSKRLFDFNDVTTKAIEIKWGATELELKKGDDNLWRFVKPNLGFADFEGPPPPKELPPGVKAPEAGVKGLIGALTNLRVDAEADFVAPGRDVLSQRQLEAGKEAMRIQVQTTDTNKDRAQETLLIGELAGGYYYARLANDEGVFKLQEKLVAPVLDALKKPGTLRNIDVSQIDPKTIDAVTLRLGKEDVKAWHPEGKPWQLQIGADQQAKANEAALTKLLETLQGKRQIREFKDAATEAEAKKLDAEMGLDAPTAEVNVYASGLEKKEEAKKDEAKDKKDDKKDEKKEEKKDSRPDDAFALKKDAKPLTLKFGKADKETVAVLRVTADGLTNRFIAPRSLYDAVAPTEGALALLDPALPKFDQAEVARMTVQRGAKQLELTRGAGDHAGRWLVREGQDKADENLADVSRADLLWNRLGGLAAKKWIKRLDPKDNLDDYGLKSPGVVVTVKQVRLSPAAAASVLGMAAVSSVVRPVDAVAGFAAGLQADRTAPIVIAFGKETADKDVYAKHSGSDLLFTVPADLVKTLREIDLRDKTALKNFESFYLGAGVVAAAAAQAQQAIAAAAPVGLASVVAFDPATVTSVRVAVRDRFELREFTFQRKDKTWIDVTGLKDFALDTEKVEQFVKEFAQLRPERLVAFAGGPRADQKLADKDYFIRVELKTDAGKAVTLTVGAPLDGMGYFLHVSSRPGSIFLVGPATVGQLQRGVVHFAKERAAE